MKIAAERACWNWPAVAAQIHSSRWRATGSAGIGRQSPLRYTDRPRRSRCRPAGIGRQSPLRYTAGIEMQRIAALELAGSRRSDTLLPSMGSALWLELAGSRRSDTLRLAWAAWCELELAGSRRSDTLTQASAITGFAGIGRQSPLRYTNAADSACSGGLGLAGSRRSDTLDSWKTGIHSAGIGRQSPLRYTRPLANR